MLQSDEAGSGFTLVELLVAIAILALRMGILMPTYQKQQSPADARHNGKVNVAFIDGHAERLSLEELGYVRDAAGTIIADGPSGSNRLWSGTGRNEP